MNFRYFKNIFSATLILLCMSSCISDLDVENIDPRKNTQVDAEKLLNKCYAEFVLEGYAPGESELDLGDSGLSVLFRLLWNANELTTDEAICGWTDKGIAGFNFNTYDSSNDCLYGLYWRLSLGVTICNQYLKECSDYNKTMTAEAHFLRALYYYYLLDNYGNPAYSDVVGTAPEQIKSKDLFEKIVAEVEGNMNDMLAPSVRKNGEANYGRADQSAAWMLLMRLYLNAEKYTGTPQWEKAKMYAEKVIKESGREIWMGDDAKTHKSANGKWSAYQMLFMADNDKSGAAKESVFSFIQEGKSTASWGGATFLVASTSDKYVIEDFPATTSETWGGNRTRKNLIEKFIALDALDALPNWQPATIIAAAKDDRALFYGDNSDGKHVAKDRTYKNEKVANFNSGIATIKYSSHYSDGSTPTDTKFVDNDIVLFRLAEAYLAFAEAEARAANSKVTLAEGTRLINILRERANADHSKSAYTLNEILDERARELYFEGNRRQDLIRYGFFGGNSSYVWQWKGGKHEGANFEAYRNIFPLPSKELGTNKKLVQNDKY